MNGFGGREDYFAVNAKPAGVSTSYRVSGRLGELAKRFMTFPDADQFNKALNQAYQLGHKHALEALQEHSTTPPRNAS